MSNNSSDLSDISLGIVEIDEELKDDAFFCPSSEGLSDDLTNILKQWKQNEKTNLYGHTKNGTASNGTSNNNKYIDSRTFTRPKKKTVQNLESAFYNLAGNDKLIEQENQPTTPVNLKVGGLVTSMQGSFLANTTPPFCMENSLINSNDFSSINFLSNPSDQEDDESSPVLDSTFDMMKIKANGYSFANVISDTKFLENLCDETFLKDENISKTDCILTDSNSAGEGSANSTLQNSEIFANNDTFVAPVNTNGNTTITHEPNDVNEMNGTFCVPPEHNNKQMQNETFTQEENIKNTTFPKLIDVTYGSSSIMGTPQQLMNGTFIANDTPKSPVEAEKILHTPENDFKAKLAARKSMDNITPIRKQATFTDDGPLPIDVNLMSTPLSRAGGQTIDVEDNYEEMVEIRQKRPPPPPPPNRQISIGDDFDLDKERLVQREEEQRNSLFNFVEFEKSISMLENRESVDEKEFDKILNALTNSDNRMMNERMRQNLDNIKKRHSLINQEKQHQEQLRKSVNHNNSQELLVDTNRLNESIKSMNSSTSERLLNRRSRLFDEVANGDAPIVAPVSPAAATIVDATEKEGRSEKHNRDRYKTIRIFRKPGDPEIELPNADHPNDLNAMVGAVTDTTNTMPPPQSLVEKPGTSSLPRSTNIAKKSGLTRPKFFGSKQNLHIYQPKSSSADDLLGDRNYEDGRSESPASSSSSGQNHHAAPMKAQIKSDKIKSPMGVKAKSFHNIAANHSGMYGGNSSGYGAGGGSGAVGARGFAGIKPISKLSFVTNKTGGYSMTTRDYEPKSLTNMKIQRPNATRVTQPTVNTSGHVSQNVNETRNLGGVTYRKSPSRLSPAPRPKSAYYSHNFKRNNEETEFDQYSPAGLSSAGITRGQTPEHVAKKRQVEPEINRETLTTTATKSNENLISIAANGGATAGENNTKLKPSGLRPPSNLRQPMARSGLPRPTGIPRR